MLKFEYRNQKRKKTRNIDLVFSFTLTGHGGVCMNTIQTLKALSFDQRSGLRVVSQIRSCKLLFFRLRIYSLCYYLNLVKPRFFTFFLLAFAATLFLFVLNICEAIRQNINIDKQEQSRNFPQQVKIKFYHGEEVIQG